MICDMGQSALTNIELDRTALLLDIDGTLAPIEDDPAAVVVPDSTLALVEAAQARCARVGIVTGRSLDAARELVPVAGVWFAACHGMHVLEPSGTEDVDPVAHAARPHLDTALTLARTVGWRHEDKGYAITLHFRHLATPELTARQMRAQMATVLDPRALTVHDARMALEIRPTGGRTKADAVRMLAADSAISSCVMIGDDMTDLDAFTALNDFDAVQGIRVAVDSEEAPAELAASADIVLPGQASVEQFLAQLLEQS